MADDILKTLIAEALGEGPEGMRLVAETILNRAAIRDLSPEEVVRQPKQYTGLNSPGPAAKRAWSDPQALSAAQAAWELAQAPGDPTGGADHYYAPGTISQPYWAKGMKPTVEAGGHKFFSSRPLPPGELPQVATALSTVPTPRNAPVPVTPSVDLAMYRRNVAPSQFVPDTFAGLNKPRRTLGDELAMSPIQGGRQQAPMFDAAFDERTGTMRLTREPMDTQGMYVGRSKAPAPAPLLPSAQLAARRATDPALQAALNAKYPAQLPELPPAGPVRTASDRVRGNPLQTREQATTIASIPTTGGLPSTEQILNGTGFRGGGPIQDPDRLTANVLPPALYGGGVAGVGTQAVAPVPFPPYRVVGSQVDTMPPLPLARPNRTTTALPIAASVAQMPARVAPRPMMRPAGLGIGALPAQRAPLRITVSGANPIARPTPILNAARSVTQSGDYSSGNQLEVANLLASGNSWREAQARKK